MNTTSIAVINGQHIQISNDEHQLVPIKPICDALGVAFRSQLDKIKEHPILSTTVTLGVIVAGDEKQREMACLPLEFVFGWIFTINPNNVREEARESLIKYQEVCYRALFEYFTRGMKKERELLEAENRCLKSLDEARAILAEHKEGLAKAKRQIAEIEQNLLTIRDERHNPQPSIFD